MKLSIDTQVLNKYNISPGEFLAILFPYLGIRYTSSYGDTVIKKLAEVDLTAPNELILSDNSKNLVSKVLVESSDKLHASPVKDFDTLALTLQEIYPRGNKPGTSYPWRSSTEEIAQKLRTLVVVHDFIFTEDEAISAARHYVEQFSDNKSHMKLLKYFLLRTKDAEIESDFMTIIENNR